MVGLSNIFIHYLISPIASLLDKLCPQPAPDFQVSLKIFLLHRIERCFLAEVESTEQYNCNRLDDEILLKFMHLFS